MPLKFAHKEGHFIPGQMYVGALKINTNENDEMAKNVTLKQMQPKIFKF